MTDMENWDSQELVTRIGRQQEAVKEMADALHRMEYVLLKRMEKDGATAIPHPNYTVVLKRPVVWNRERLTPLRELLPPDVLALGFQPRHEETVVVEDAWNMVIVKSWGKYGAAVREVLTAAQGEGAPRLSVTPRKERTE